MIKKCAKCGTEVELKGNGKYCESCKTVNRAKSLQESIGDIVEETKQPQTIGMIETKQKQNADEMWDAIRLLHSKKSNVETLISHAEEGMKKYERKISDNQHKMFLLDMSEQDLLTLAKEQRELLSKRSGFKNLLNVYRLIDRLTFEPEVSKSINYSKSYALKEEVGRFSFGDNIEDFISEQNKLKEEELKVKEEKAANTEALDKIKTYIEELHQSPVTGKMIKTIAFAKNSLEDLQSKVGQLEFKCKAFRVDLVRSTLTGYN